MKVVGGLILIAAWSMAAVPEYVPGEYVVTFRKNKSTLSLQASTMVQSLNSEIKSLHPHLNIAVIKSRMEKDTATTLNQLRKNPAVEIAEPNYIYHASKATSKATNDPLLSKLWGMINVGQPDSSGQVGTVGIDINAANAWKVQTGSKDVVVAVIDTGVNYKSEDLKDNMWINLAEKNGKKALDDDKNGYVDDIYGWNFVKNTNDPLDDHGHGSHCSGTIGAKGNDKKGIVGVNWNTRIMALKFLDSNGSGSLDNALKAIDYATQNGAKVLSNSWGGGSYSETLKQAIERSNAANTVFVAAAGNESNNNDSSPSYPASYDVANIISVAAIDNRGNIADFSNYGKTKVHVAAPGVNIYSTILKGYDSWSGTSMATPHVSGITALMYSQYPTMTNAQIKNFIIKTARPLKSLKNKVSSGGLVDAYAALMQQIPAPDLNDPMNWQSMPYQVSSEHPYKSEVKNTWEVSVPNAQEISLYFEKMQTEFRYDTISLYDRNGGLIQTLTGDNDDTYSEPIKGNYVKVVFESDKSQEKYGFDISKVSYR